MISSGSSRASGRQGWLTRARTKSHAVDGVVEWRAVIRGGAARPGSLNAGI